MIQFCFPPKLCVRSAQQHFVRISYYWCSGPLPAPAIAPPRCMLGDGVPSARVRLASTINYHTHAAIGVTQSSSPNPSFPAREVTGRRVLSFHKEMRPDPATSPGGEGDSGPLTVEKKGWLTKRTQFTRRWKPVWLHLRDARLLYGDSEQGPLKTLSLAGATLACSEQPPCRLSLTAKGRRHPLHLQAEGVADQQAWLVALCEAQLCCSGHAATACLLQ